MRNQADSLKQLIKEGKEVLDMGKKGPLLKNAKEVMFTRITYHTTLVICCKDYPGRFNAILFHDREKDPIEKTMQTTMQLTKDAGVAFGKDDWKLNQDVLNELVEPKNRTTLYVTFCTTFIPFSEFGILNMNDICEYYAVNLEGYHGKQLVVLNWSGQLYRLPISLAKIQRRYHKAIIMCSSLQKAILKAHRDGDKYYVKFHPLNDAIEKQICTFNLKYVQFPLVSYTRGIHKKLVK